MKVLAAVSGGADSVCMLLVLKAYRQRVDFELEALHVEHGIRGEESRADAAFVQQLCREQEIRCQVVSCDARQAAVQLHMSLEEAARTLRYEILRSAARERECDVIATAHHAGDQAETVLWNLARGTGTAGLGGIRPCADGLIRPMLEVSREEIEAILQTFSVSFRTDATNTDQTYTRNRIRSVLLPWMEQNLNRQAGRHICQAAEHVRSLQDFASRMADEAQKECVVKGTGEDAGSRSTVLLLDPFERQDPYLQGEILRRCVGLCRGGIGQKDIGTVHIQMLRDLVRMPCGKQADLPGIRVFREDGKLVFCGKHLSGKDGKPGSHMSHASAEGGKAETDTDRKKNGTRNSEVEPSEDTVMLIDKAEGRVVPELTVPPWHVRLTVKPREDVSRDEIFREKTYTKYLSYDTITCNVCFRRRRPGDYLVINVQGGRKKLNDYLTDQKVPRLQRDRLWLAADGNHVLWVPGYRISEDAKVTEDTRLVLILDISPVR